LELVGKLPHIGRRTLTAQAALNSLPELGNSITITNHTDRRALIGRWSLVWAKGLPSLWIKDERIEEEPEYDAGELTIEPRSRKRLGFVDGAWFDWGIKSAPKGKLYLKIWYEGSSRAHWFHLHTPGK
jgi:hypothetical protein